MRVTMIASTRLLQSMTAMTPATEEWLKKDSSHGDADFLSEFAGRACYESWSRPNPKTADTADYLAHILEVQHFSILEHASATFYIQGVSRSLTHELIRHRHLSYSQLSQRYVDHGKSKFIIPPVAKDMAATVVEVEEINNRTYLMLRDLQARSLWVYREIYREMRKKGRDHKTARGAARAALLESTETSIVVTGNHRAWREFVQKRNSPQADEEIRNLASLLLNELRTIAPGTYSDFDKE